MHHTGILVCSTRNARLLTTLVGKVRRTTTEEGVMRELAGGDGLPILPAPG